MDLDAQEGLDSRIEFRKPSNDVSNRKYRRRSPGGGSSSSGSPLRNQSLSPVPSQKDNPRFTDDKQKKDDIISHSGRSGESYKHNDRRSSRSYHRHNDHGRRERYPDDYDRGYPKFSRSRRDTRDDLDYRRGDKEHHRDYSRSHYDSGHKSKSRDSFDQSGSGRRQANREERSDWYGKTDHKKGDRDHRSEKSPAHLAEESSRGQQNSSSHTGNFVDNLKDNDQAERYGNEGQAANRDHGDKLTRENSNHISGACQESTAKRSKFSSSGSSDLMKEAHAGTSEQGFVTDSDIDAAKLAAMKAAELVNKNLVGTGYMSADQKKKLLWGNKKNENTTEDPAKHWDSTMFVDRERQEKFNKLMGVKGDAKIDLKSDNPDVEKQREQLQMELEKQYTAGLRRRDGRTVGLGL